MSYQTEKKVQIAKQLGISVAALEQYLQLKQAEASGGKPDVGDRVDSVQLGATKQIG
jgi:predicted transcriptional regulator